jgi:hypothetical protein
MDKTDLSNRENSPASKAAEWAYRSAGITFFGIIPYLFFSFCALARIEPKSLETMLLLKLGFKRVWKNTVIPFLILGALLALIWFLNRLMI